MAATVYYDKDVDPTYLEDKVIGVLGYGSQGHAQALNLKDSGLNVIVGLYKGSSSWAKAEEAGFKVGTSAEVAAESDVLVMLLPDTTQPEVYRNEILPNLSSGKSLVFSHGFAIHYKTVVPPDNVDVWMVWRLYRILYLCLATINLSN